MKWILKYFLHFILIILLAFLIFIHPNPIAKAADGTTVGGPGVPAVLYLLLDEGIQPVTDYDTDSFDSSVDCNDQATSCTTDCTDEDGDAVSDCLDLCIDNDFDGYGRDNSASIIGNGSVPVSECTVFGLDPCILNEACYGSDCNDNNSDIYPTNADVCNGVDDDCNPATEDGSEDPEDGAACDTGQLGVCAAGTINCIYGSLTCTANNSPSPEICDDVYDNDCDGVTDCADTADCGGDPACQVIPCNTYLDKKSCQDAGCTWSNPDKVCM